MYQDILVKDFVILKLVKSSIPCLTAMTHSIDMFINFSYYTPICFNFKQFFRAKFIKLTITE